MPAVFGPMANGAGADDPARRPSCWPGRSRSRTSGRPGPVVMGCPCPRTCWPRPDRRVANARPVRPVVPGVAPPPGPAARAARRARAAGDRRWPRLDRGRGRHLRAVAEASRLPVAVSWRSRTCSTTARRASGLDLGERQPGPGRAGPGATVRVVAVGPAWVRSPPAATGCWTPVHPPAAVHVLPAMAELGRLYQPDLAVNAAVGPFLAAWRSVPRCRAALGGLDRWRPDPTTSRSVLGRPTARPPRRRRPGGNGSTSAPLAMLRERLPDDAIVASGAVNYSIWCTASSSFRRHGTQLAPKTVPWASASRPRWRPRSSTRGDGGGGGGDGDS